MSDQNEEGRDRIEMVLDAHMSEPGPGEWDTDKAWAAVQSRMDAQKQSSGFVWRAAAAVILVALGSAAIAVALDDTSKAPVVITAAAGRTRAVTLPDGSAVVMGPSTRIEYAASFKRNRQIALEGEAYFSVEHSRRTFEVRANGVVIRDIGTRFNVRAYADDSTSVTVTQGSVEVRLAGPVGSSGSSVVLTKSQRLSVARDGSMRSASVDTLDAVGWRTRRVAFDGITLDRAVAEIERMYGIQVLIESPALARRRVTAQFGNRPADVVLNGLAAALHAEWSRSGDTIRIRDRK